MKARQFSVTLVVVVAVLGACAAPRTGNPVPSASSSETSPSITAPPGSAASSATPNASPTTPSPSSAANAPVLASATQVGASVDVSGFMPGVLADGSVCRFELTTSDGVVHRIESRSQADATVTTCPSVSFSVPDATGATAVLVWAPTGARSAPLPVSGS